MVIMIVMVIRWPLEWLQSKRMAIEGQWEDKESIWKQMNGTNHVSLQQEVEEHDDDDY